MSRRLVQAHQDMLTAEKAFERVVREDYPAGSAVSWDRNGRIFSGCVIQHTYSARVLVRNAATTRTFWIYATDIVQATKAQAAKQAEKVA